MAHASHRPLRIAFQHPWNENAEHQAFESMRQAAARLGHEMLHVRTSQDILAGSFDLVLCVASLQGKTTHIPTFGAIHEPRLRWWEQPSYFHNLLSYDGYLTISDSLRGFLRSFASGFKKYSDVGFYFNTPQKSDIQSDIENIAGTGNIKLGYFGTNWDKRSRPLFRELSKRQYIRIHGPEQSWDYLDDRGYYGPLPFDGASVQRAYADYGVGLVSLSSNHMLDDVISNRVFEITSVGAVAIAPRIDAITDVFGDSVYYFTPYQGSLETAREIDEAMAAIAADPSGAARRAKTAREIFETRFSAEVVLENALGYYDSWKEATLTPKDDRPAIDVVMRLGGRPIETVLRAIKSIESQTNGRFRLILVLWKDIELSPVLERRWDNIDEIVILPCPNGRRADTLTAGLKAVSRPWFCVLDDDDLWLPNHIASLLAATSGLPSDQAFAYSALIEERPAGESDVDIRRIVPIEPASGDLWDVLGKFSMHNWIASSALLGDISLDGWSMNTAEDTTLIGNLIGRAQVEFSWTPTAVFTRGQEDSSNFVGTPTRDEDVFEAFLRLGPLIDKIERKFAKVTMPTYERLGEQVGRVFTRKLEASLGLDDLVALEDGARVSSIRSRTDLEVRVIEFSDVDAQLTGASTLRGEGRQTILSVLPPHQAWAYGAVVPLSLFPGPQFVVVEIETNGGQWGFGILNRDGTDFIARSEATGSRVRAEIWLHVPDASQAGMLVIQNWDQPNTAAASVTGLWLAREPIE